MVVRYFKEFHLAQAQVRYGTSAAYRIPYPVDLRNQNVRPPGPLQPQAKHSLGSFFGASSFQCWISRCHEMTCMRRTTLPFALNGRRGCLYAISRMTPTRHKSMGVWGRKVQSAVEKSRASIYSRWSRDILRGWYAAFRREIICILPSFATNLNTRMLFFSDPSLEWCEQYDMQRPQR